MENKFYDGNFLFIIRMRGVDILNKFQKTMHKNCAVALSESNIWAIPDGPGNDIGCEEIRYDQRCLNLQGYQYLIKQNLKLYNWRGSKKLESYKNK